MRFAVTSQPPHVTWRVWYLSSNACARFYCNTIWVRSLAHDITNRFNPIEIYIQLNMPSPSFAHTDFQLLYRTVFCYSYKYISSSRFVSKFCIRFLFRSSYCATFSLSFLFLCFVLFSLITFSRFPFVQKFNLNKATVPLT